MSGTYDPNAWAGVSGEPAGMNALLQPGQGAPTMLNALSPPMAQQQGTQPMSVEDMIKQLRGDNPPVPVTPGMTDTNLTNYIYSVPSLQARLRPDAGGPQYPGAPMPGVMPPGWSNGTG